MNLADKIVDTLLEGDMDAFIHAAIGPMLQSWAKPDKFQEGRYVWSCPTHINEQKAKFTLYIDPDMPVEDSDPPRTAISLMCGLIDLSGQLTTYGSWFGFTHHDDAGLRHILMSIYNALAAMKPVLRKPVVWRRHEAIATAAGDRFDFMQKTVIGQVMPGAKSFGVTYFRGAPKSENQHPV